MRISHVVIPLVAALTVLPFASAASGSGSGDCKLLGSTVCRLSLTLYVDYSSCDATGCWYWISCGYTISGVTTTAEGSCYGVPWALPCGTGSCSDGTNVGRFYFPHGGCYLITANGVGHGLGVDSTGPVNANVNLCV